MNCLDGENSVVDKENNKDKTNCELESSLFYSILSWLSHVGTDEFFFYLKNLDMHGMVLNKSKYIGRDRLIEQISIPEKMIKSLKENL